MKILIVNIQWMQYLSVLGIVLIIFYAALFLILSRRKNKSDITTPKNSSLDLPPEEKPDFDDIDQGDSVIEDTESIEEQFDSYTDNSNAEDDAAYDSLEELAYKIEEVLKEGEKGINKDALLSKLQVVINNYPQLNKIAFRVAINNVIIKRSKQHCNIIVSEEEANSLWVTV